MTAFAVIPWDFKNFPTVIDLQKSILKKTKLWNFFIDGKDKISLGSSNPKEEIPLKKSTVLSKSNNGLDDNDNNSVNGGDETTTNNNDGQEFSDDGYNTDDSAHDAPDMTPIPGTPTNSSEADEMKEYWQNKVSESQGEDDAYIKQKAISAYQKDAKDRTASDNKYIKYAENNLLGGCLTDEDKIDHLRQEAEVENHTGRAARFNGNIAREKLVRAGFPDPGSIPDVDTSSLPSSPSSEEVLEKLLKEAEGKPLPFSYERTKTHDAKQGTFTLPGFTEATGEPSQHSTSKGNETPIGTEDEDMIYDATPPRAVEDQDIYDATPPRAVEDQDMYDATPPRAVEDQDIYDATPPREIPETGESSSSRRRARDSDDSSDNLNRDAKRKRN